ncbi:MAG: magnesium/cobalt transporter CorA [Anaerolineae bacterium]
MSHEIIQHNRVTWINVVGATVEDTEYLREHYGFHPLSLEDCLSRIERPKIDEYDDEDYLFIVMHFPIYDHARQVSRASEVDFFIGSGFVVTVHDGVLKPLVNFFNDCRENEDTRNRYMDRGASFLLHAIIDRLVDYIFPILYKVESRIRDIEEDIFTEDMRRIVRDLSLARRDIIALRRIIRPQVAIVANLEQVDRPYIREELEDYFGDILDHLNKVRDIIDEDYEVLANLSDTGETLTSYRINEVMRILTVISVIMLPLTLISGIYGMNVTLPLAGTPYAFLMIIGLMVIISGGMLVYFRYRGWL